jgi:hypothetical protein
MTELDPEIRDWVIANRRAQGLPDHIEDPVVLARIIALLTEPATRHENEDP